MYLRRLAICSNTTGYLYQKGSRWEIRTLLEGQLMDIPFEDSSLLKDAAWDFQTALPGGSYADSVTAFEDLRAGTVREPILEMQLFWLQSGGRREKFHTQKYEFPGSDGVFNIEQILLNSRPPFKEFPVQLEYLLFYRGTTSLRQKVFDVSQVSNIQLGQSSLIGRGLIHVIDESFNGCILTSDIDQTYLNTEISTTRGKLRTMFEPAREKDTLPGMTLLYQEVRKHFGEKNIPYFLKFISASPFFFRRVLAHTFLLKDVDVEGIHLKNLQGILNNLVFDSLANITNLNRLLESGKPSLGRASSFLEPYIHNFFDQTGYKLILLLKNRLAYPPHLKEILIGDNTESDFLIFAFYKKILEDETPPEVWNSFFESYSYDGKKVLTKQQIQLIAQLIRQVRGAMGAPQPVIQLILIHKADSQVNAKAVQELFNRYNIEIPVSDFSKELTTEDKFVLCENALEMSLILQKNGFLDEESLPVIQKSMIGQKLRDVRMDNRYFDKP